MFHLKNRNTLNNYCNCPENEICLNRGGGGGGQGKRTMVKSEGDGGGEERQGKISLLHFKSPVGIWCQNDVVSTSMRRNHVASTLIRRHFRTKCPLGSILSSLQGIDPTVVLLNKSNSISFICRKYD